MFQHFGARLKRDLKQIVDRRLDANAAATGGNVRVSMVLWHRAADRYLNADGH